jgi:NADH:ubiquinone oxidoreductase subunit E
MKPEEILEGFSADQENMLNILHAIQDSNPQNYLTEDAMKLVAEHLNTTFSHVYGVATYYTMYSLKPRGKYIIRLCNSPVCNMEGSTGIAGRIKEILGISMGETTSDKLFTLEWSECLGQCDKAPVMMINKSVYGNLTEESLRTIFEKFKIRESGK